MTLKRVKNLPQQFSACLRCLFSPDSKTIFLVKSNRDIDIFDVPDDSTSTEIKFRETINTSDVLQDSICQIEISACGKYLVCAGLCCNIGVWKSGTQRRKVQWNHLLNLPKYKLPPTALGIHRNTPKLVVAFADSKVCKIKKISSVNAVENPATSITVC